MIKLPARQDGQWTVRQANNKLPDIISTRNLTFDKDGYVKLSKPVVSFYSDEDDADFGVPLYYGRITTGRYRIVTDNTPFFLDMFDDVVGTLNSYGGRLTVEKDATTGVPIHTYSDEYADGLLFKRDMHFSYDGTVAAVDLGAFSNTWSDVVTGLGNDAHPMVVHTQRNTLCVADGNEVKQYDTSYASGGSTLTIPSDYDIYSLSYNNGYIAVGTHDRQNSGLGAVFIWDGTTAASNYAYRVGASTINNIIPYKGSFVIVTGAGQLLYWTPSGFTELANMPTFLRGTSWYVGGGVCTRNSSNGKRGDIIFANINADVSGKTNKQEEFIPEQPTGIWSFDDDIGLYHRHAPTAIKVITDVVATTDVDTSTDEITVTTAPETGTPVRYYAADEGTAIGGLGVDSLYYTIKVDATTIQLANTYTEALAGTEIDITGTGNDNQILQFYPKSDFGQSFTAGGQQGAVQLDELTTDVDGGLYFQDLFYGAECYKTDTTTRRKTGGFVLQDTENRGYLVTSRFQSQGIQDEWQKIFIKHKKLRTDLDKIVVKYRKVREYEPIVKIGYLSNDGSLSGAITWTDSDTYTTTDAQYADVMAGDEVEVVQGAGSGYLLHIDTITEDGGTYTVNLAESVKNISANDTARAVVDRWSYLTTIDSDTISNEDGYSEIPVDVKSRSIQFKIELRGEDIEIEEILVANQPIKPVA